MQSFYVTYTDWQRFISFFFFFNFAESRERSFNVATQQLEK